MTISPAQRRLLTLICTSAPSFMLQLDANIVSVSLPAIAKSVHADFAGIEWVVTAYMLSFACLMMPAGALADRYGRKPVLIIGLTTFTFASLLCGLSTNLPLLIASRALQGAGAALQLSSALATLSHAFRGADRARAFSFWGSVVGIGIALGPVTGGVITQWFGWQWSFFINVPIGFALVALVAVVIEPSQDPAATRLDGPGVVCFGASLFLITLALISGNRDGWTDPAILTEGVGAIAFLCLFLVVERRQARPMLDLSYFLLPTYVGAIVAQFAMAAGLLTLLTYLPIYLQGGLGASAGTAGLMMLPMATPLFFVPPIVSRHLAHRLSGRELLAFGLAISAVGLGWLGLTVGHFHYPHLVVGMLLTGIGAGLLNGETTKVAMTVIPPDRAGMASGVSGTVRFTGIVIGIAALGVVLFARVAASLSAALPGLSGPEIASLARDVASGRITATVDQARIAIERQCLGQGYAALLIAAAATTAVAAVATWLLVRTSDTMPSTEQRLAGGSRATAEGS